MGAVNGDLNRRRGQIDKLVAQGPQGNPVTLAKTTGR